METNIQRHIELIQQAIEDQSDLVVFPELSITNYEPQLAKELAIDGESNLLNEFQNLSNESGITICLGMPLKSQEGIHIGMLIFQRERERSFYRKQILHEDEVPFFVPGDSQTFLNIKGKKIAFGICYETLQKDHFVNAHQQGADIYIGSVAKPQSGIDRANAHFPLISREFKTPILMSNSVGPSDNFISAGQSAAWNDQGQLVEQLSPVEEGILTVDIS